MMPVAEGKDRRRSRDPVLRSSGKISSINYFCLQNGASFLASERMRYSITITVDLEISDRLDVI
jgi:hypothetical protein